MVKYVLVPINMLTFRFSPFKFFHQLLIPKKNFIFTFGPLFKVNSYVTFLFFRVKYVFNPYILHPFEE